MVGELRRGHSRFGRALIAGVVLGLLGAPLAYADTLTVTTTNDWGLGCLRHCVADADPGDEIVFDSALDGQPIMLTGSWININKKIKITGRGPDKTIIDGNQRSGVLYVGSGAIATISGLTLKNGSATARGGGIYVNRYASLDLVKVHLVDNYASHYGGALFVDRNAAVTLTDSVIRDNYGYYYGGGIYSSRGSLMLVRSEIRDNRANYYGGAIYSYRVPLTMTDSTVSDNSTSYDGGAIYADHTTMSLTNSTLSGNSANRYGGAIYVYGSPLTLANVTLTDNSAPTGGGIVAYRSGVTMSNSLVADQLRGQDCYNRYSGSFTSLGHNLDSDGSCNLTQPTDLPYTEPMLRPLADHFALDPATLEARTARVHLLMPESPAIDAAGFGLVPYDQRGFPRNLDGDRNRTRAWDIGAVEFVPYRFRVRSPTGGWIVIVPDPL